MWPCPDATIRSVSVAVAQFHHLPRVVWRLGEPLPILATIPAEVGPVEVPTAAALDVYARSSPARNADPSIETDVQ